MEKPPHLNTRVRRIITALAGLDVTRLFFPWRSCVDGVRFKVCAIL